VRASTGSTRAARRDDFFATREGASSTRSASISYQSRVLLCAAALSLLLATIAGAVGSHVLAVDDRTMHSFETAVQFQFFHGLGLIGITLVGSRGAGGRLLWSAAWLIVVGTVLFCGSIYARTFGAPSGIVSAAPYGGVAFMVAWLLFAVSVWRSPPRP
jgi:uncharacterized membrane protein YgdD (TMEM256/DUF423 family)